MVRQTKNLIKKLKLKPKFDESKYSQSFINRERKVAQKIMDRTNTRIVQKKPDYLQKKDRISNFKNEIIFKKLGLFKKMTEEERILMLSK